jgi:hypothetical protein
MPTKRSTALYAVVPRHTGKPGGIKEISAHQLQVRIATGQRADTGKPKLKNKA